MSRARLAVMGVVAVLLLALLGWQNVRVGRVEACLAEGKIWNGPASRCEAPRPVIIERELKRT